MEIKPYEQAYCRECEAPCGFRDQQAAYHWVDNTEYKMQSFWLCESCNDSRLAEYQRQRKEQLKESRKQFIILDK